MSEAQKSVMPYRVIYGDCDPMGIMYHANYFRLAEGGRAQFCRDHGLSYADVEKAGFAFPAVEAHIKYMRPAMFDELVETRVWLSQRTRIKLVFNFEIVRGQDVLAAGHTVHACLGKDGRPVRLPAGFEDRFPVLAVLGPTNRE